MTIFNQMKEIDAPFRPGQENNGIFARMNAKCNLNVADIGVIHVSARPTVSMGVTSVISRIQTCGLGGYVSVNVPESFIMIDLKNWRIQPTHYLLVPARIYNKPVSIMSWVLEGSADAVNWFCLDERRSFSGECHSSDVYQCFNLNCFRFFRITQTSKNSIGTDNFGVRRFDLFGQARRRDGYIKPVVVTINDGFLDGLS